MSKVYLREAESSDIDLLFKWANDPVVRNNSFNTDSIPYENHVIWFDKMMSDPSVLQYILVDDDSPVGQIRLNVRGSDAEIGYSIGTEFRGKGYGHMILKLIKEKIIKDHAEIINLIAKVKPDNDASNALFQKENFEQEYKCYCLKLQNGDEDN